MARVHFVLCLFLTATAGCAAPAGEATDLAVPPPESALDAIDWQLNFTGPLAVSFIVVAPNGTATCDVLVDFVDGSADDVSYSLMVAHDQHPSPSWTFWGNKWYEAHAHVGPVDSRPATPTVNDNGRLVFDATYHGMPDGARFTVAIHAMADPGTLIQAACDGAGLRDIEVGRTAMVFNADSAHNGASATVFPSPAGTSLGRMAAASVLESVESTVVEETGRVFLFGRDIMTAQGTIRAPSGETQFDHVPDPIDGSRVRQTVDDHAGQYAVEWTQGAIFGDELVGAIVGLSPFVDLDRLEQTERGHPCTHPC